MSFQKNTLKVATVILIITLAIIGWMLYTNAWKKKFPAYTSPCPDFWEIVNDESGKGSKCKLLTTNTGTQEGECQMGDYDIFNPPWSDLQGNEECKKNKWSTKCDIMWDGISNNTTLCKDDD